MPRFQYHLRNVHPILQRSTQAWVSLGSPLQTRSSSETDRLRQSVSQSVSAFTFFAFIHQRMTLNRQSPPPPPQPRKGSSKAAVRPSVYQSVLPQSARSRSQTPPAKVGRLDGRREWSS